MWYLSCDFAGSIIIRRAVLFGGRAGKAGTLVYIDTAEDQLGHNSALQSSFLPTLPLADERDTVGFGVGPRVHHPSKVFVWGVQDELYLMPRVTLTSLPTRSGSHMLFRGPSQNPVQKPLITNPSFSASMMNSYFNMKR